MNTVCFEIIVIALDALTSSPTESLASLMFSFALPLSPYTTSNTICKAVSHRWWFQIRNPSEKETKRILHANHSLPFSSYSLKRFPIKDAIADWDARSGDFNRRSNINLYWLVRFTRNGGWEMQFLGIEEESSIMFDWNFKKRKIFKKFFFFFFSMKRSFFIYIFHEKVKSMAAENVDFKIFRIKRRLKPLVGGVGFAKREGGVRVHVVWMKNSHKK